MFKGLKALIIPVMIIAEMSIIACNEPDVLGLDLQPEDEQLGVNRIDTFTVNAFVKPEDSLVSSLTTSPLFLGSLSEPFYYGSTHAGFVMQVRIGNTMANDIFDNVTNCDSIVLSFAWQTNVGDSTDLHHISVYRNALSIHPDSIYYTSRPVAADLLIGHADIIPDLEDSVIIDSVARTPHFRMALDPAFGNKLIQDFKNNPSDFTSQASFLNYFKGIVMVDSADGEGSIMTFEPASSFNRMTLYFGGDKSYEFVLDNSSARYNYFRHNYNADLKDSVTDTRLVVESMAGLKTRIYIPHLSELKNKLGDVAINNAQLLFNLEPGSDITGFTPHNNLLLLGSDSLGKNTFLIDQLSETSLYIGGLYNSTSKEYKFNISRYVQRVLTGTPDYGIYLVAGGSTSNARRTILQGGGNLRFIITYTLVNP